MQQEAHPIRTQQLQKEAAKKLSLAKSLQLALADLAAATKEKKKAIGRENACLTNCLDVGLKLSSLLGGGCYICDGHIRIGKRVDREWRELDLAAFIAQTIKENEGLDDQVSQGRHVELPSPDPGEHSELQGSDGEGSSPAVQGKAARLLRAIQGMVCFWKG